MCQEQVYMTLLIVFSELIHLNIILVHQLFLLLLSHKKLYHLCGLIKDINNIKAHFSFMLSLYLYNIHGSHFAYQGVCRLILSLACIGGEKKASFHAPMTTPQGC